MVQDEKRKSSNARTASLKGTESWEETRNTQREGGHHQEPGPIERGGESSEEDPTYNNELGAAKDIRGYSSVDIPYSDSATRRPRGGEGQNKIPNRTALFEVHVLRPEAQSG